MKKALKRTLYLLLCAAVLVAYAPTVVMANSGTTLTLDTSNYSTGIDPAFTNSVFIPVQIEAVDFYGAELEVLYDTAVFDSMTVELDSSFGGELSQENNKLFWESDEPITKTAQFLLLTFAVKSDAKIGDTTVQLSGTWSDSGYEDYDITTEAKLTVVEPTPMDIYLPKLALSGTQGDTVTVGDVVELDLSANKAYSAMQMTIEYNSAKVSFDPEESTLGGGDMQLRYNNDAANGVLKLATYGAEKDASHKFVLAFKTIAEGEVTFEITEAKYGTGESAATANLEKVALEELSADKKQEVVTVQKAQFTVTLDSIFAGANGVQDGATYTFAPETATGAYYDYQLPTATMNGEAVTVTATENGWTIANVTGNLVISGERTPKSFDVTVKEVAGGETTSTSSSATYGTAYEFTLPNDIPASQTVGYTYTLTSVTIGGTAYTGYTNSGRTYTIPGAHITGVIEITITKTEMPANQFTVSVTGTASGAVTVDPDQKYIENGTTVTLTLVPEAGYTYSLTVDGQSQDFNNNQYSFKISKNTEVKVNKTLDISSAATSVYIQLDEGQEIYLVTIGTERISNKTYTFGSQQMYWSDAYGAYAILVIAADAPDVTAGFDLVPVENIPTVTYDGNVNGSVDMDANDAQLVWNMYQPNIYKDFTDVTMDKYLSADVNKDSVVDVMDARWIINAVLGNSNETSAES